MKRVHDMPFGTRLLPDGRVRFRLWAPGARRVALCLEDEGRAREFVMAPGGDGWYELETGLARAGSRYRYRIDGALKVPDPASRFNPGDVHGASMVWDVARFEWDDEAWRGRPWVQAVIYELHVGTFSPEGSFAGVEARLDHLCELGVTALELMPVGDFSGRRGWGYDAVLPFAPDASYGTPDDLKRLVRQAHRRGLMVLLDVVYNHFGPDGNYLHAYAEPFFNPRHHTPWGAAINFDGRRREVVREFFVHNALYWLTEFSFDGLRLDAVHAIVDDSRPPFLEELAARARGAVGGGREVHLVLENDDNRAHYLRHGYTAQWNDDFHHAAHVLLVGERDGYYADYAADPVGQLGRCLAEGYAYQGEASAFRHGAPRGEPSRDLPPTAFVSFLQNHDQIGNRPLGERLSMLAPPEPLRAVLAVMLLAPQPPLLFMGEEFAAATPFLFFCDFTGDLAHAVRDGRRREFRRFAGFAAEQIPDPNDEATFRRSILDWSCLPQPPHAAWLAYYRRLLALRRAEIAPRLANVQGNAGRHASDGRTLSVQWRLGDGARLLLLANLDGRTARAQRLAGRPLFASHERGAQAALPPWYVAWSVVEADAAP